MSQLSSVNPSNYELLGEVTVPKKEEVENKVKNAKIAQKSWENIGLHNRITLLRKAFEEFESKKEEFCLLESREMGMPIVEARMDFDASIDYTNWYFENAEKYLSPETTFENENEIHQVFYEPIGVVAVILPWNFPFANFVWGTIQNLIAGNTVVMKHSEECILCGKFIEEVMLKHLPNGVFNEIYGDSEIGKCLVDQSINMISFTGSTKTGKFLYEFAGKKFIKSVMELGGSAPGIIFEDADLENAIENVCFLRLLNQGQCCDGLKRLIVHESIFDEVVQKVSYIFAAKKIGNAERGDTEIGPLVSKKQLDLLISQIEEAKSQGAKAIVGGSPLETKLGGFFFEPTVFIDVKNDMRVWKEEVFGPVLPIVKFQTEEEAIELANHTDFGLGAYVFTKDSQRADRVSQAIQSGMVSINGTNYIMPFNPFGGYKNSGFGREHGKYGFSEVTQVKIVARKK